jgi:hypothetical protein
MTRLNRLALRANGKAVVQTPAALVRVRAPYLKNPPMSVFLLSAIRKLQNILFVTYFSPPHSFAQNSRLILFKS